MDFLVEVIKLIGLALVFLLVYYGLNTYILKKIKINKWIVLGLFVLSLIFPYVLYTAYGENVNQYAIWGAQGVMVILLLWFLDLAGFTKRRSEKVAQKIEEKEKMKKSGVKRVKHKVDKKAIKPKAKPNPRRVKKD